jgi:adenylate cyclase
MTDTRKLAAILVPDVVGYSRLAGADEDRARLRTFRSDLIDPMIAAHHGRIVKRTGDGSIIEFPTVVDKSIGPIRSKSASRRGQNRKGALFQSDVRRSFRWRSRAVLIAIAGGSWCLVGARAPPRRTRPSDTLRIQLNPT